MLIPKILRTSVLVLGFVTLTSSFAKATTASELATAAVKSKVMTSLSQVVDLSAYRETRMRFVGTGSERFALVYLVSKTYHRFELARAALSANGEVTGIERNYQLKQSEMLVSRAKPKCPDESVEFVAFAPNDQQLELDITNEVAKSASDSGLNTVTLLKEKATRENYLNYMSCPRLVGNFYDGDANPQSFTTFDGEITAVDMATVLKGEFRYKVTNIWLACQAFNDPILTSVKDTARSQKYAAGKNDLLVGPSDKAAGCAMQAAIKGQPMTAAFWSCYKKLDDPNDQWGFDGTGSDYFAH